MKCSSFLYGGMIKKFIISRFFMIIYFADIINSLPFYVFITLINRRRVISKGMTLRN
jgi:hypothetical protein